MKFNKHSNLEGQHALLGGSQYHWINYDDEKMARVFRNMLAKEKGTILHDFASRCVKLGQRLPDEQKTINMFVNDAIDYAMESEQILYYSDNCFGTADAICYRNNFLRIHDLKTGSTPAHMEQLLIYAALFCLEYNIKPAKIKCELRIYQSNKINYYEPTVEDIAPIIDKIQAFDRVINEIRESEA